MMSMADLVAIGMETQRIDSGCSLEKKFTELICMNPLMLIIKNENEIMISVKENKGGKEIHIGERGESSKSRIAKVPFWAIYTHTLPQAGA